MQDYSLSESKPRTEMTLMDTNFIRALVVEYYEGIEHLDKFVEVIAMSIDSDPDRFYHDLIANSMCYAHPDDVPHTTVAAEIVHLTQERLLRLYGYNRNITFFTAEIYSPFLFMLRSIYSD